MRRTGWGIALGALGLLAAAPETRADTPGELAERLRKATAVLTEMAGGRQDTQIPPEMFARARAVAVFPQVLDGRYAVPASARAFVNALTTYSPPPRKR
jgi:lipid-binding SYLF domain-containing protein